jgi:hypothetical protein
MYAEIDEWNSPGNFAHLLERQLLVPLLYRKYLSFSSFAILLVVRLPGVTWRGVRISHLFDKRFHTDSAAMLSAPVTLERLASSS